MSMTNAYCKKHDEMEPDDNRAFWSCPQCSREHMKRLSKPNADGVKLLDTVIAAIDKRMKK